MADPSVLELCRLRDQAMACVVYDNWQILGAKIHKTLGIKLFWVKKLRKSCKYQKKWLSLRHII